MIEGRWEHGSDFAWPDDGARDAERWPWGDSVALFGSGRDALRALVAWGARARGWRRVWLPSFYCQDVPAALLPLRARGVEIAIFVDGPDRSRADAARSVEATAAREGDVVVVVNFLGLRAASPIARAIAANGATIVEDHTHDPIGPWASASDADYAFASLRKALPLPDGGAAWSPRAHALPDEAPLDAAHAVAALDRLSAMLLKGRYLAGLAIDKEAYRARALAGEERIGSTAATDASIAGSGITPLSRALLPSLPARAWRARRAENHDLLARAIGEVRGARALAPEVGDAGEAGAVPFAYTLVFDDEARRDLVRRALVAERVYPAVLWPLDAPVVDGIPREHLALARRVMSLHCDQRYTSADLERVAAIVRRVTSTI